MLLRCTSVDGVSFSAARVTLAAAAVMPCREEGKEKAKRRTQEANESVTGHKKKPLSLGERWQLGPSLFSPNHLVVFKRICAFMSHQWSLSSSWLADQQVPRKTN